VPVQSDPLSYLVSPAPPANIAACDHLNMPAITSSPPSPLDPGTYCGTFTISGAATTVTFNPGVYIIAGSVNWSAATINGTGVTLFLTKLGTSPTYGTFTLTNTRLTLSAPTSLWGSCVGNEFVRAASAGCKFHWRHPDGGWHRVSEKHRYVVYKRYADQPELLRHGCGHLYAQWGYPHDSW
jgi:hypothetical protein